MDSDISRQIDGLIRANRRLRFFVIAGLLVVGSVVLVGQAQPPSKALEVEKLTSKDGDGNARATLGFVGGSPELALLDKKGERRLVLALDDRLETAHINMRDGKGVRRLALILGSGGHPTILLRNKDAKVAAMLAESFDPQALQEAFPGIPPLPADLPAPINLGGGMLGLFDSKGNPLRTQPVPK